MNHFDAEGHPVMVDVGAKNVTDRMARAEGWVLLSPVVMAALDAGTLPKGDALKVAEVAGIAAAKRASLLIPLCHSIVLDHVALRARAVPGRGVHLVCTVRCCGRTGVEMEALTGVSGAALAVYDMCKGLDRGARIDGLRLLEKSGGRSGHWMADDVRAESEALLSSLTGRRAFVVTLSDRCSHKEAEDTSGPALVTRLAELGAKVVGATVLPDEPSRLTELLTELADGERADLVICTGGTGLAPRDRTPEVLKAVADFEIPGFGEEMRAVSRRYTARAGLSRGLAVARNRVLMVALPGSRKAALQCLGALEPLLAHGLETLKGETGDCGR